mgnify:CR=1 FL=1
MKKIIKIGDNGPDVKLIQVALNINDDGNFGSKTLTAVKEFQASHGLNNDGVVGIETQVKLFKKIENLDSEITELPYDTLIMQENEFNSGPNKPAFIFYHHTAGWHNPYNVVKSWNNDKRGKIGTEWVVGGPSIRDSNKKYDGQIVKCMPDNAWGYHLGNVNYSMHVNSIGIELCNFGQLRETTYGFKTYAGQLVDENQVYDLGQKWRGYRYWHKYSNAQIEALYDLTKMLAVKYNIDLNQGLKQWLTSQKGNQNIWTKYTNPNKKELNAFEYKADAKNGLINGLLSHSNVRKDKFDISPQKNLIEMIKSL